jgi:hypothetical protein
MKNIKGFEDFIKERRMYNMKSSNIILTEGGSYGHMDHPFEDNELTFGDIKEICNLTINGLFTTDNMVAEKTDGQNLMVSWKDGVLIAARNLSHRKNRGENALTKENIADHLDKDRTEMRQAWTDAMTDLENALSHCNKGELEKMFRNGERFMSMEVICPEAEQTIPYGNSMLVFHGWKEYDINGNEIGEDKISAYTIAKLIGDVNQQQQNRFLIRGPQEYNVKPFENHEERYKNYIDRINKIMSRNSAYTDETTIKDFIIAETKEFLYNEIPELKDIEWNDKVNMDNIAANVSKLDRKSLSLTTIKSYLKQYAGVSDKIDKFQKNDKFKNIVLKPIISLFMDLGLDTCRNIRKFLTANPEEAAVKLRKKYLDAINEIKENGTDVDIQYMEDQLAMLSDPSALEDYLPTEGISFLYKGKIYKLTGYFQVLNRICGYFKYKK